MLLMEEDLMLIEKKLAGELKPDEEAVFKQRLLHDTDFEQQYRQAQEAIALLQQHQDAQLKQELRTLYGDIKTKRARSRRRYYGMAAAIGFLLIAGLAFWFYRHQPQQLFQTYYEVYYANSFRGEVPQAYEQGMIYYQQNDYQQAIPYLERVSQQAAADPQTVLYLGNSYLNTNETEKAIRQFTQGLSLKDAILRQHAAWYLALSYLKKGEKEPAKKQLHEIIRQQGIYQEKAEELLSEL